MKKIIFLIATIIIIIIGILSFNMINTNDSNVKFYENESSYEVSLEDAKVNTEKTFKINKDYKVKYKFTKLEGETLTYKVYVNDKLITTTSMVDFSNSEFDVDEFYLYGNTLVYFTKYTYNKEDLFMYVINDDEITKMEPEYDELKGLRLHSYISSKDGIEIIASRRNNDKFIYGEKIFDPCKDKLNKEFTKDTIVEKTYKYSIKDNKLNLTPKETNAYTYEEYKTEGDEIICE